MTIRSGGRARDRNQARPAEPARTTTPGSREYAVEPSGRGGRRRHARRRLQRWATERAAGGIPGFLKFLIFASSSRRSSVTLVTVLRPLVRDADRRLGDDNPPRSGAVRRRPRPEDLGDS
jgi:hypothetical protein